MAVIIVDLGVWEEYIPDAMPEIPGVTADTALPSGIRFCRNEKGTDWYIYRADWPADFLYAVVGDTGKVGSVTWGAKDAVVPLNMRVLQIMSHDPADQTPWKTYEGRRWDPDLKVLYDLDTNVQAVSAVQAEIQLSRMKMGDGKTTVLDALTAMLPSAGVETNLWYRRAQTWRIDDQNVQKLGGALGLSAADMQAAFNAADQIGV